MRHRRSIISIGLAAVVGVGLAVASATLSGQAAGASCDPVKIITDPSDPTLPDIGQDRGPACPLPEDMPPPPDFAPLYGPIDMMLAPEYMPVANEQGQPVVNAAGIEMCMQMSVRPPAPPAIPVNGPDPVVGEDIDGREWPVAPGTSPLVPCPSKG